MPAAFQILYLVPLFPLVSATILLIVGKRLGNRVSGFLACSSIFLSFLVSCWAFIGLMGLSSEKRQFLHTAYQWVTSGNFIVSISFLLDPLSAVMMIVVSGVSFVIHVYSIGYMHGDSRYTRYFGFLNLFVFFMLCLVMAGNLFLLYLGWEGVGLCSYLLIGFWFEKIENARAGMKAFIVNRIGDFGFLLGLILLFWDLGSLDILTLNGSATALSPARVTLICLLLFMGATGKSAQLPLYVWLPDAMAGPTPVSALIHAATMVTAGVYMVARMHFLFDLSPFASSVVAWVGGLTAVYAATIALVQNDIKRVLAYSTISQLGYMFIGVGVGAYAAGIFHLVTHSFFKALLFLGAGSVMHALGGETDLRKMGGLRSKVPWTFWTMFIGCMAIAGVPGLSGFFSKEAILGAALEKNVGIGVLGIVGAGLTAFYMFRLLFMTFFGAEHPPQVEEARNRLVHESPWVMLLPLVILAVLSMIGGHLGVEGFLESFFEGTPPIEGGGGLVMGLSILMALGGIGVAYLLYIALPGVPQFLAWKFSGIYRLLLNKYYVDEIYNAVFVAFVMGLKDILARFDLNVIDRAVDMTGEAGARVSFASGDFDLQRVDGAVNALAEGIISGGANLRRVQTGYLQNYFLIALAGAVVMVAVVFLVAVPH